MERAEKQKRENGEMGRKRKKMPLFFEFDSGLESGETLHG